MEPGLADGAGPGRGILVLMDAFLVHTGTTAVYNADHVDTDRIIPARFLSQVSRSGYGKLLFVDARAQEPGFALDDEAALGASVLVVGTNFGCGSSREHAVWAIQQAGFVCVIGRVGETPGFSDIFRQNSANCGLLLIELPLESHSQVVALGSGARVTVDLPAQSVSWDGGGAGFEINPATKDQLLRGLDLVGTTLEHESLIGEFESGWDSFVPR